MERSAKRFAYYVNKKISTHASSRGYLFYTLSADFSQDRIYQRYTFAIDILKRLFSDDNVGFYAYDLSFYYRCIASQYVKLNDKENVLKNLKESCRYAIIEANLNDMDYTAPMVNRLKHKKQNISKNYKGNACNLRIEGLKDKMFDFVRDEDEFKQIIADLEKYAENE